jgi:hypothetical protein
LWSSLVGSENLPQVDLSATRHRRSGFPSKIILRSLFTSRTIYNSHSGMVGLAPHDLETFQEALLLEATDCLQSDNLFLQSTSLREQCAHECRTLRKNHSSVVPYSVIGPLLQVHSAAVRRESKLLQSYWISIAA